MKKFAVVLILLIVGTSIANLSNIVSIASGVSKGNGINPIYQEHDGQPRRAKNELDYHSLKEILTYLHSEAAHNYFEITTVVISSALLFESEDVLIIIGHGHFDSNGRYSIGNYQESRIKNLAGDKEVVVLLSCYSARVALINPIQVTFPTEIDFLSALLALGGALGWTQNHSLLPARNFQLFELDPRDPVNGWSINNSPPAFNLMQLAQGEYFYWDLQSENGLRDLSRFLLNNKMTAVRFYFSGEFLEQINPNQNGYYITIQSLQFDSWIYTDGDWDYLYMINFYINGVLQKRNGQISAVSIKVYDILNTLISDLDIILADAKDRLANIFVAAGIGLIASGIALIAIAT